jgi:signal transduction histidine kinase
LRVVGLVVWLVIGSPSWTLLASKPQSVGSGHPVVWSAAYLSFAAAFVLATSTRISNERRLGLLAYQSAVAVFLAFLGMPHFEGALFAIVSAQAPSLMRPIRALAWDVAQAIVLFPIVLPSHGALGAAKATGEYFSFALFALLVLHLRAREASARQALARTNAELLATQSLLADDAKTAERMRVAREVHDAIGHGLTAASLHLQIAARASAGTEGATKDAVLAAQAAVKETLADVRGLVRTTRDDATVDLGAALRALCSGITEPELTLKLPPALRLSDPARAHALFRCVQEAVTNSIRHSGARHVWIDVDDADGISLTVKDDGVGASAVSKGSGLKGIEERIAEMNGTVVIETSKGAGLTLRARVPHAHAEARE